MTDEDQAEARLWHLMGRGAGKAKGNQLPPKLVRKNKKGKGYVFELKINTKITGKAIYWSTLG